MQVKLRLQFHPPGPDERTVLAQMIWPDITSGDNPFWREVYRSTPSKAHFGFLNIPHTSDEFVFHLGKSGHLVNFRAETKMGAEISIFGTVTHVAKAEKPEDPLRLNGDTIAAILENAGWMLL